VQGVPAEDMPQITSRICGVCPTAHHMAATKALDNLYRVDPPPTAKKIRELVYNTFMAEDHALHFYFLGGPDFVMGPDAPPAERNVLGVIGKVGIETGKKVIEMRRRWRELIALVAGKVAASRLRLAWWRSEARHPEMQKQFQEVAADGVEFAKFTLRLFEEVVLKNTDYVSLSSPISIRTVPTTWAWWTTAIAATSTTAGFRVVAPDGKEWKRFKPEQYLETIAEHV